jgi:hypothetical protein
MCLAPVDDEGEHHLDACSARCCMLDWRSTWRQIPLDRQASNQASKQTAGGLIVRIEREHAENDRNRPHPHVTHPTDHRTGTRPPSLLSWNTSTTNHPTQKWLARDLEPKKVPRGLLVSPNILPARGCRRQRQPKWWSGAELFVR